ncbi:MAG TPA: phasin family protein [Dyella sp.]|uniref:phasin family protein n=1 Tax=Dyella sp. TaxID=1869338 RepID=UPI002C228EF6|nr:phasin family protein [Dyella sp.]HTV84646.1 phasin family protein [Dyella sp.]
MSTQADIPFELYKANLQFALRTNKLLKECGQRWLDTFDHAVGESIAESQQEIDKLSVGEDWQSLTAIPGETFLRLMQERVGDAQSVAQAAVVNQTKFLTGLQDAFLIWQRETAKAMGGAHGAKPYEAMVSDFFKLFSGAAAAGASRDH